MLLSSPSDRANSICINTKVGLWRLCVRAHCFACGLNKIGALLFSRCAERRPHQGAQSLRFSLGSCLRVWKLLFACVGAVERTRRATLLDASAFSNQAVLAPGLHNADRNPGNPIAHEAQATGCSCWYKSLVSLIGPPNHYLF